MKDNCYLVVKKSGITRMNKTPPSLGDDELAVKIDLVLPDNVFGKPRFEAKVELTEEQVEGMGLIEQLEVQLNQLKKKNQ